MSFYQNILMFCLAFAILFMALNGRSLASEMTPEVFIQEMLNEVGAELSDCPADMADPGSERVAVCARLEMEYKKFKRTWDKRVKDRIRSSLNSRTITAWRDNKLGYERLYEIDGTLIKVFRSKDRHDLIFSYFKDIEYCETGKSSYPHNLEIKEAENIVPPKLIPESKVSPAYPWIARRNKKEGKVIMQAVIKKDGTVDDVCVLRVDTPGFNFEIAAAIAMRQWRYKPALQDGR
ncbi:MAG: energy transducer TonB, partial [Acidobacteriota bacterium]